MDLQYEFDELKKANELKADEIRFFLAGTYDHEKAQSTVYNELNVIMNENRCEEDTTLLGLINDELIKAYHLTDLELLVLTDRIRLLKEAQSDICRMIDAIKGRFN